MNERTQCNNGVECGVRSCRYHNGGRVCSLKKIMVTSDIGSQHYCGSFEQRSDAPEF
jgi:hypothetical protein